MNSKGLNFLRKHCLQCLFFWTETVLQCIEVLHPKVDFHISCLLILLLAATMFSAKHTEIKHSTFPVFKGWNFNKNTMTSKFHCFFRTKTTPPTQEWRCWVPGIEYIKPRRLKPEVADFCFHRKDARRDSGKFFSTRSSSWCCFSSRTGRSTKWDSYAFSLKKLSIILIG